MMIIDDVNIDEDKYKYKGYGHILAIGRDNPSPFFFNLYLLYVFLSSICSTKRRYEHNGERHESNAKQNSSSNSSGNEQQNSSSE